MKRELSALRETLQPLAMRYAREKARVDELRRLQQKREEVLVGITEAEARMDLARVADLKYGALTDLDAAIAKLQKQQKADAEAMEVSRHGTALHCIVLLRLYSVLYDVMQLCVELSCVLRCSVPCTELCALVKCTYHWRGECACQCWSVLHADTPLPLCDVFPQAEAEEGGVHAKPMLTEHVGPEQIAEVVSRWTGIPVTRLGKNEKERLLKLGDRLKERVVGQVRPQLSAVLLLQQGTYSTVLSQSQGTCRAVVVV